MNKLSILLLLAAAPVFGQCVNQALNDFDNGTAGATVTASVLSAEAKGATGTWFTVPTGGGELFSFSYQSIANFGLPQTTNVFCAGNASVPASAGIMGVSEDGLGLMGGNYFQIIFPTKFNKISMAYWMCTDITHAAGSVGLSTNHDISWIGGATNGDYDNVQFNDNGDGVNRQFRAESGTATSGTGALYPYGRSCSDHSINGGWVQIQMLYDATGVNKVAVYDVNGTQIGTTMTVTHSTAQVDRPTLGHLGTNQGWANGFHIYYDSVQYSTDGTFPIVNQGGTGPFAPVVVTTAASGITQTTATAGGTVTSDGGSTVTARGTCYATTANPTSPCTSDGTGTGAFTSSLTGLTNATLYHIRAFATNAIGTSYGSDLTFTTGTQSGCTGGSPTWTTTPDFASVSSCVTSAVSGDTINIVAGTANWGSSVLNFPAKKLTIKGADVVTGSGNPASNNLTFTDNTVITCTSRCFQSLVASSANFLDIGYLTFSSYGIFISGTHLQQSFHIHHDHMIMNVSDHAGVIRVNNGYGLLDHIWWDDQGAGANSAEYVPLNVGGDCTTNGYSNWNDPTRMGTNDAVYIEDSKYTTTHFGTGEGLWDAYYGAKVVTRYNTIVGNEFGGPHGTDSGQDRAGVFYEFYGNNLSQGSTNVLGFNIMNIRGGTIYFFNNTITGSGWDTRAIPLQVWRFSQQTTAAYVDTWGVANAGLNWSPKALPASIGCGNNWFSNSGPPLYQAAVNTLNDATQWAPNTVYAAGAVLTPSTLNRSVQAKNSGTSGASQPAWPSGDGGTVNDNGITWVNVAGSTGASVGGGGASGAGFCSAHPDQWCSSNAACNALVPGDTCSRYFDTPVTGYPYRDQPGVKHDQILSPSYSIGNTVPGTWGPVLRNEGSTLNSFGLQWGTPEQPNRDFYVEASPFTGASGTGEGLLSARPATCTTSGSTGTGVGYFATDVGPQGTLYGCTATNTWTAIYTPYTYPHPLQSGVSASWTISPLTNNFGNQQVSTPSTAAAFTLTNVGASPDTITAIGFTGTNTADFSVSSQTCGTLPATIANGANCVVNVVFTPGASGARSANLNITTSTTNFSAALSGTGTVSAPVLSNAPTSIAFGNQPDNTTSGAQAVIVTNTGTATATSVTCALTTGTQYAITDAGNCTSSLAANASFTLHITFTPTTAGLKNDTLTVSATSVTPSTTTLSGTGVAPAPALSLAPATIACGSSNLGVQVSCPAATLTNTGNASATISTIAFGTNSSSYSYTATAPCNSLPATLTASSTCTITAKFTPGSAGSLNSTLTVTDTPDTLTASSTVTATGVDPNSISLLHPVYTCNGNWPLTCTGVPASTAGSLWVLGIIPHSGSVPTVASITDPAGDSFSEAASLTASPARCTNSTSLLMADTWIASPTTGSTSFTVNITADPAHPAATATVSVVLWEFSNANSVDQVSMLNDQPASISPLGAAVTLPDSKEVIVAQLVSASSVSGIAAGNAFTNDSTLWGNGHAHLVTVATGNYQPQWASGSGAYCATTASFKFTPAAPSVNIPGGVSVSGALLNGVITH